MRWIKYILGALLLLSFEFIISQQPKKINFKVNLKSVEHYGMGLKNSTVSVYTDGILTDSIFSKKKSITIALSSNHIYKITFSKKNYATKHVIINTIDVPSKKRLKIKADISLFRPKKEWEIDFLNYEPVSIANYNFLKKKLVWDFDYNRSVVEKIILATIKK